MKASALVKILSAEKLPGGFVDEGSQGEVYSIRFQVKPWSSTKDNLADVAQG